MKINEKDLRRIIAEEVYKNLDEVHLGFGGEGADIDDTKYGIEDHKQPRQFRSPVDDEPGIPKDDQPAHELIGIAIKALQKLQNQL